MVLVLLVSGCGSPEVPAPSSTAAPTVTVGSGASTPTVETPSQSADELTAQYVAALKARGFAVTDEDDAWSAGAQFCGSMGEGEGLINSTAELMDSHGLGPDQARQVAAAALEAICPQYD